MSRTINPELRSKIESLINSGKSKRSIARELDISFNTVLRWTKIIAQGGIVTASMKKPPSYSPVPRLCKCGCGQSTNAFTIWDEVARTDKIVYRNWVKGHRPAPTSPYRVGRQKLSWSQRSKQNNQLRAEMVAAFHQDRFTNRGTVIDRFLGRGLDRRNLGKLFVNGLRDLTYKINEDELPVPKPRPMVRAAPLEPYERKTIPHENATDIKYLTRSGRFISLDDSTIDDGMERHELIHSDHLDPAEVMMRTEEMEENRDFYVRRDHFIRWEEAKRPLNSFETAAI